jgi:hypothetical protein
MLFLRLFSLCLILSFTFHAMAEVRHSGRKAYELFLTGKPIKKLEISMQDSMYQWSHYEVREVEDSGEKIHCTYLNWSEKAIYVCTDFEAPGRCPSVHCPNLMGLNKAKDLLKK